MESDSLGTHSLGVLVHEVRSPVAALAAVSEAFAGNGLEPDERRELAQLAVDASRSIERLLTDHAVASVRLEDVDVGQVVRAAVVAAAVGGATVRAILEPRIAPLRADPLRLRQALDNLVQNAVVHGGSAEVVVRAETDGGEVIVSVEDSGPGISEADQARIFEAGTRLASDATGTGLGLAIARAIANAHGGVLDVRSAPGEGATFTLRLPLAQPATDASRT